MLNLIRTDIKRFMKDKCFIACLFLILGFALLSGIGVKLLEVILASTGEDSDLGVTGFSLMLSSLSPENNVGIIVPILLSIIMIKDYTHGTIRNKIVSGHTKTSIYLSSAIVMLLFGLGMYIINALINLLIGGLFFGFGNVTSTEVLKMFGCILLATVAYSAIILGIVFAGNLTRSIGVTIVVIFVGIIALSILGRLDTFSQLPAVVRNLSKLSPTYNINLCMSGSVMGTDVLFTIISTLGFAVVFNVLGIYFINKRDIK